jgi:hypothetical protein
MRAAHVLGHAPSAGVRLRGPALGLTKVAALLSAPWLDRQLASAVPTWRTPRLAARAVWLTNARRRAALARSLEQLAERAEEPVPKRSPAVPPRSDQMRDALPEIMAITARLRSGQPLDARGVAMLRALLADGGGPCYVRSCPSALTEALREASQWLSVAS